MRKAAAVMTALMVVTFALACAVQAQDDLSQKVLQLESQMNDLKLQLEELKAEQARQQIASEQVREIVEEPEGPLQATVNDVAKLKKIKVSGYLQSRYESYSAPAAVRGMADHKSRDDRLYVRRGRFKITGQPTDKTVGVVQLDIAGYDRSKVESKDLYLEYHPCGVGVSAPFFVRVGQQNWPFGYIIERSSSAREVPERPKVFAGTTVNLTGSPSFNGLFPGERDRGVSLFSTDGSKLEWALGLFNGTGTKAGDAGSAYLETGGRFEDNSSAKTVVGRVRYPISDSFNLGASLFSGSQSVRPALGVEAVDVNQSRLGLDFQYYFQGASIKGEYVTGKEPFYSNTSATPNGRAGSNRTVSGWYLVGVKNLGSQWQLVAQYDELNDRALDATFGKLSTWNLGVVHFLDDATKLKFFYELNSEENASVRNNGLRLEMLTAF